MEHELRLAGRLQATFLPDTPPTIPGWQIALMLQPAGAASGDFYDIARLSRGRWGILMADVVDKGVSAAIYMVLCWSLIRTYAVDYPEHPERVLQEANRRLLATRANEFVTVFYGVLDPATGALVYANAGHCPPLVLSAGHGPVRQLARTGIPLGIDHDHEWNRAAVELAPATPWCSTPTASPRRRTGRTSYWARNDWRGASRNTGATPRRRSCRAS